MTSSLFRKLAAPLGFAAFALLISACDTGGPIDEPSPDDPGLAQAIPVQLGADFPEGRGDDFGLSPEYFFNTFTALSEAPRIHLSTATLLLTGVQDGQTRYSGGSGAVRVNVAPCDPRDVREPNQYFRLASGVEYEIGEWPVERGAPLTDDGAPRVYGDLMAWNAYCSGYDVVHGNREVVPPTLALQDLRINHAAFQYERADLEGVRFLRYEITNLGDVPITDLRAALFTDPDVGGLSDGQDYRRNLMGSAADHAFVYTSDAVGPAYRGATLLLGLIETPKDMPEAVRRVIYRDRGPAPEQAPFTSLAFWQEADPTLFHALRGLDDDGDPVLNPITGETTTRMFEGDPVAGTGWLDGSLPGGEDGWDIRVVQSTEPFALAPSETVVLTAVAIAGVGADVAGGLAAAEGVFDAITAEPGLWRFPASAN